MGTRAHWFGSACATASTRSNIAQVLARMDRPPPPHQVPPDTNRTPRPSSRCLARRRRTAAPGQIAAGGCGVRRRCGCRGRSAEGHTSRPPPDVHFTPAHAGVCQPDAARPLLLAHRSAQPVRHPPRLADSTSHDPSHRYRPRTRASATRCCSVSSRTLTRSTTETTAAPAARPMARSRKQTRACASP